MEITGLGIDEGCYTKETFVVERLDKDICDKIVLNIGFPIGCSGSIFPVCEGGKSTVAKTKVLDAKYAVLKAEVIANGFEILREKITNEVRVGYVLLSTSKEGLEELLVFGVQVISGLLCAMVSGRAKGSFVDVPRINYGDVTAKAMLVPTTVEDGSNWLYDLQSGSDYCFTAEAVKSTDGEDLVFLIGNGWVDQLGFPTGELHYPLLRGKTAENFRAFCDGKAGGRWDKVYSGDINDLVELIYAEDLTEAK